MRRRAYLVAACSAALAGCLDGGSDPMDGESGGDGPGGNGSGGNGSGGDGSGGNGRGEDGDDGGDGQSDGSGDDVEVIDVDGAPFEMATSFAVDVDGDFENLDEETRESSERITMDGEMRYDGRGNVAQTMEMDMGQFAMRIESVTVDGTVYTQTMGSCTQDQAAMDTTMTDPEQMNEADLGAFTEVGTDTIDGEPVTVYELTDLPEGGMMAPQLDGESSDDEMPDDFEITYYVSSTTGYPVRAEFYFFTAGQMEGTMTMTFHSWGESFDIQAPEDCS